MRVLNVAEKPSVAKEISNILSGGHPQRRQGLSQYNPVYEFPYEIQHQQVQMVFTSVTGHLMELDFDASVRSWHSCDPTDLFTAKVAKRVRGDETQKNIEKTLVREARQSQWLVLWLDCDREGENIAFEVKSICERASRRRLRVSRARFSALIPRDIVHAVQHLVLPNEQLSLACDARSEIDLRIGAAFTRFQTMRIQRRFPTLKRTSENSKVISYGPCQFPTLGFVVERFLQVQTFEREPFYRIDVTHQQPALDSSETQQTPAATTAFAWKRARVYDRIACLCLFETLVESAVAVVERVDKRPTWKRKPLPLTTVELQKRASTWLRVSSEQTMKAAESLYNKGLLSYPRTETNKFQDGTDLVGLVQLHASHAVWGAYVSTNLIGPNSKFDAPRHGGADDQAHPPIHPTKSVALTSLSDDTERKVYEFVTRHFLACCSLDAVGHQTNVQMRLGTEGFTASGLMIEARNYLDVYKYEKWSASAIPLYAPGDTFVPTSLTMETGETAPPPLLSESDLIAKMDANGIGTDATIAEHIKTILKREYAEKVNNNTQFQPTTLGLALVLSYEHMGLDLAKPALRAAMENDCKAIALGQKDHRQVVTACMEQMRDIFLSVRRNADVLDQTFSEQFQLEATDDDHNGFRVQPPPPPPLLSASSAPAPIDSTRPRRSANDSERQPPQPPSSSSQWNATTTTYAPPPLPSNPRRSSSSTNGHEPFASSAARNSSSASGATADVPRCPGHGLECAERQVTRDGPNNGRFFFVCPLPQAQQCDHFAWADAPTVAVRCTGHDEPCNERIVKKDGPNKGRTFYACRHDQTETCGYFQFKDELPGNGNGGSAAPAPTRPPFAAASSDPNAPVCPGHRVPCVLRVTRKPGDNLGREFFVCGQQGSDSCGFFVWKDEAQSASSSTNSNSRSYQQPLHQRGGATTSTTTTQQVPVCSCGLPGVLLTCRNGANQGRTFYKCPQPAQDQQCSFFEWVT